MYEYILTKYNLDFLINDHKLCNEHLKNHLCLHWSTTDFLFVSFNAGSINIQVDVATSDGDECCDT